MCRLNDRINQEKVEVKKIDGYQFGKHRNCVKRHIRERDNNQSKSETRWAFWNGKEMSTYQIRKQLENIVIRCRIVGMA